MVKWLYGYMVKNHLTIQPSWYAILVAPVRHLRHLFDYWTLVIGICLACLPVGRKLGISA